MGLLARIMVPFDLFLFICLAVKATAEGQVAYLGGYSILRLGSAGVNWREAASTICGVLAASVKIERTKKKD